MAAADGQMGQILHAYLDWRLTGDLEWLPVSYTHLRAHETVLDLVCRLLLEKKNDIVIYLGHNY